MSKGLINCLLNAWPIQKELNVMSKEFAAWVSGFHLSISKIYQFDFSGVTVHCHQGKLQKRGIPLISVKFTGISFTEFQKTFPDYSTFFIFTVATQASQGENKFENYLKP